MQKKKMATAIGNVFVDNVFVGNASGVESFPHQSKPKRGRPARRTHEKLSSAVLGILQSERDRDKGPKKEPKEKILTEQLNGRGSMVRTIQRNQKFAKKSGAIGSVGIVEMTDGTNFRIAFHGARWTEGHDISSPAWVLMNGEMKYVENVEIKHET